MWPEDIANFEPRAREEREDATQCDDVAVAKAHAQMAEEYERRAREGKPFTIALAGEGSHLSG